jgi:hypothetical protein
MDSIKKFQIANHFEPSSKQSKFFSIPQTESIVAEIQAICTLEGKPEVYVRPNPYPIASSHQLKHHLNLLQVRKVDTYLQLCLFRISRQGKVLQV